MANLIRHIDGSTIDTNTLTGYIQELISANSVTGMAVTVFNDQAVAYHNSFGAGTTHAFPLTQHTVFYGASLSKPVFSMLLLMIVEEGLLDLDTPLRTYLAAADLQPQPNWWEDFSSLEDDPYFNTITARMCLSHTSGLPNWRWHEKNEQLLIKEKPGTRYRYSGEGFCLMQYVLKKLTGCPLQQLTYEKIFKPLGMSRSAFSWQKKFQTNYCFGHDEQHSLVKPYNHTAERAASTLYTTAHDYGLFLQAVIAQKLIPPSLYRQVFSTQVLIHSEQQFGDGAERYSTRYNDTGLGYGLGWGIFQTPYGTAVFKEGHGSGFAHYVLLVPGQGSGLLIMSNDYRAECLYPAVAATAFGDRFSPFSWNGYVSYQE